MRNADRLFVCTMRVFTMFALTRPQSSFESVLSRLLNTEGIMGIMGIILRVLQVSYKRRLGTSQMFADII